MKIKKVVLIVVLMIVIIFSISLSVNNVLNQWISKDNLARNDFDRVTNNEGFWPVGSEPREVKNTEPKEYTKYETNEESQNKLIVTKVDDNKYKIELNTSDYQWWQSNYPLMKNMSIVIDGKPYSFKYSEENSQFGRYDVFFSLIKNIDDRFRGARVANRDYGCDPTIQNIELVLKSTENEQFTVSNIVTSDIEQFENKVITHPSFRSPTDMPVDEKAKALWCAGYNNANTERPAKIVQVPENTCKYPPEFCDYTITIVPFQYIPSKKTVTINKKISFDLSITKSQ